MKDGTVIVVDWITFSNNIEKFWDNADSYQVKLYQAMIYRELITTHLRDFFKGRDVPEVGIMIVPISKENIYVNDPRLCLDFTKLRKAGVFNKIDEYTWTAQKPSKNVNKKGPEQETVKVSSKVFCLLIEILKVKPSIFERAGNFCL